MRQSHSFPTPIIYGDGCIPRAGEQGLIISMMAAIYAILLIAFVLDLLGRERLAGCCFFLSFFLRVCLFLWEIYSPEYGFRMPWLQVELGPIFAPVQALIKYRMVINMRTAKALGLGVPHLLQASADEVIE